MGAPTRTEAASRPYPLSDGIPLASVGAQSADGSGGNSELGRALAKDYRRKKRHETQTSNRVEWTNIAPPFPSDPFTFFFP